MDSSSLNIFLCSDIIVSQHLISQCIGILDSVEFTLSWFVFVQVCTAKMNLSDEVDLEDYVSRPDKISAAEVSCFCNFLLAAGFSNLHFLSYTFCIFSFT
jgi:hypothetical protein